MPGAKVSCELEGPMASSAVRKAIASTTPLKSLRRDSQHCFRPGAF